MNVGDFFDSHRHHLPDISTLEGIIDISHLFIILEFANVLSPWAHKHEHCIERRRMMAARTRARRLRNWIFKKIVFMDKHGDVLDGDRDFFFPHLAAQGSSILQYRRMATRLGYGPCHDNDVDPPAEPSSENQATDENDDSINDIFYVDPNAPETVKSDFYSLVEAVFRYPSTLKDVWNQHEPNERGPVSLAWQVDGMTIRPAEDSNSTPYNFGKLLLRLSLGVLTYVISR
jgi:hypothetical protein